MNKLKRIIIISLLSVCILPISNVKAAESDIGYGGGGSHNNCSNSNDVCYNTDHVNRTANVPLAGVRLTVVDSNGNKVSARSVDYVNNTAFVSGGTLVYNGKYGAIITSGSKLYKNQISGPIAGVAGPNPSVTLLSDLPTFVNAGSNRLRPYFLNMAENNQSKLKSIFNELGYTYNSTTSQNDYLLVETLMLVRFFDGGTMGNLGVFYGTATEVYAMAKNAGYGYTSQNLWGGAYPRSIMTDQDKAGLLKGASLGGFLGSYMLTNYGLASGHIWMNDLNPNCVGSECVSVEPEYCNTEPSSSFSTNCDGGTSGYASDITDWGCIFKQSSLIGHDTFNGQFYQSALSSNRYCNVACREDITYDFPNSGLQVIAGTNFSVGSTNDDESVSFDILAKVPVVNPIVFTGTSTCKTAYRDGTSTAKINYEQYKTDYYNADNEYVVDWDIAQSNKAQGDSLSHIVSATPISYSDTECILYKPKINKKKHYTYSYCAKYRTVVTYGMHYVGAYTSYNGTTGHNWNGSVVREVWCSRGQNCNTASELYSMRDSFYGTYNSYLSASNNAKSKRDSYIIQLNNCNSYQKTYNEFQPQVSFTYDDIHYNTSLNLTPHANISSYTSYFKNNAQVSSMGWSTGGYEGTSYMMDSNTAYGQTSLVYGSVCGNTGSRCQIHVTPVNYSVNDSMTQVTTKTYTYTMPTNVFRYVSKEGVSYTNRQDAINAGIPFIDLGYDNVPVSYAETEGNYNMYFEFAYHNGSPSLFGTSQKFLKYNKIDIGGATSIHSLVASNTLNYKCTFKVIQGFQETSTPSTCTGSSCGGGGTSTPGVTDVKVVYRPISLSDPFPGESATDRTLTDAWRTRSNWSSFNNADNYLGLVNQYIRNNRGVSGDEVYNLTPMYQFVLSANNIRAIRNYNTTVKNNYNDFNLSCDSEGKKCRSEFLSKGYDLAYFKFTAENSNGGSCYNVGNDKWESCRSK